jgi:hypothetical protein
MDNYIIDLSPCESQVSLGLGTLMRTKAAWNVFV